MYYHGTGNGGDAVEQGRTPTPERGSTRIWPSLLLILGLLVFPCRIRADSIRVSWDHGTVKRGAVVLIHLRSPLPLQAAEGSVGTDRFPLIHTKGGIYLALVGIDMNLDKTVQPVDFTLFPAKGGPPYRIRADLKVRDTGTEKEVQHLSLPTGMVDFSQKRLQQINRDSETLWDALTLRIQKRLWKKGFRLPLTGRITTKFGTRRVLNGRASSPHNGVDIAGKKGAPVKASNRGRVTLVDRFFLSGNTVVVDHGWGVSTIYAHLDRVTVSEGQDVERGQLLGEVGSTGRATGPHLHFGALVRGVKVDPLRLIEATKEF
jgi:hypothetical protein